MAGNSGPASHHGLLQVYNNRIELKHQLQFQFYIPIVTLSLFVLCVLNNRCILTPNQMEFERLVTATVDYLTNRASSTSSSTTLYNEDFTRSLLAELKTPPLEGSSESSEDGCAAEWAPHVRDARRVHALSAALGGVTVLRKGRADIIASSLGNALRRRSAGTHTTNI